MDLKSFLKNDPGLKFPASPFFILLDNYVKVLSMKSLTSRSKIKINGKSDISAVDFWSFLCYSESLWPYNYTCTNSAVIGLTETELKKKSKKELKKEKKEDKHFSTDKSAFIQLLDSDIYILMQAQSESEKRFSLSEPSYSNNIKSNNTSLTEWIHFKVTSNQRKSEIETWFHISHVMSFLTFYGTDGYLSMDFSRFEDPFIDSRSHRNLITNRPSGPDFLEQRHQRVEALLELAFSGIGKEGAGSKEIVNVDVDVDEINGQYSRGIRENQMSNDRIIKTRSFSISGSKERRDSAAVKEENNIRRMNEKMEEEKRQRDIDRYNSKVEYEDDDGSGVYNSESNYKSVGRRRDNKLKASRSRDNDNRNSSRDNDTRNSSRDNDTRNNDTRNSSRDNDNRNNDNRNSSRDNNIKEESKKSKSSIMGGLKKKLRLTRTSSRKSIVVESPRGPPRQDLDNSNRESNNKSRPNSEDEYSELNDRDLEDTDDNADSNPESSDKFGSYFANK